LQVYVSGYGELNPEDITPADLGEARREALPKTEISLIRDRSVTTAADGLSFPNTMVITPNGRTLIVAETFGFRISAYDRDPKSGALTNRRVWAQLGMPVDGICLDAEGCIWAAIPYTFPFNPLRNPLATLWAYARAGHPVGACIRLAEGGAILDKIFLPSHWAIACMLGGPMGNTLFILGAVEFDEEKVKKLGDENSVILATKVNIPAATDAANPRYWGGVC
jgi:sugar lactone lactonase YvrE